MSKRFCDLRGTKPPMADTDTAKLSPATPPASDDAGRAADAANVRERVRQLRRENARLRRVKKLAEELVDGGGPTMAHSSTGYPICYYCFKGDGEHEPDCPWLALAAEIQEKGDAGPSEK